MAEEVQEPKSKKKGAIVAIVALVAVIAIAVIAYAALPSLRASEAYTLTPAEEVDAAASSALMACEIEADDGTKLTLGDLSAKTKKPIVLNVWASWCTHCDTEMPDYQKLFDEYGDRVEFVMLDLNDTSDEPDLARAYVKEGGYTFPIYFDVDAHVREAMALVGVPTSAIVSVDGDLILVRSGEINYGAMKSTLENVLNS